MSPKERKLEKRSRLPFPPATSEAPRTRRRLPIDASRQGPAHDVGQPVVDRDQSDDELGRVAEGRVEEAADTRARVLGGMLRRLADQPRQRDQRNRSEDELDRLGRMHRVVQCDRDRRERERREEGLAHHELQTLPTCPTTQAVVATA